MAVRSVIIRLLGDDSDLAKKLDKDTARLEEFRKSNPTAQLRLDDKSANLILKELNVKMDAYGRTLKEARLDVKDTEALLKLDKLELKAITIKRLLSSLGDNMDLGGLARARSDINHMVGRLESLGGGGGGGNGLSGFQRYLGRLRGLDASGSLLSRLFGGGRGGGDGGALADLTGSAGSGGGGAASGLLSSIAGASNQYTGGLIATLVTLAASITPAIVPFGIGSAVGLGGLLGGLKLGSNANKLLLPLEQRLAATTGTTAASRAARQRLRQQIASIRSQNGPALQMFSAGHHLARSAENTFFGALTSEQRKPHGGTVHGSSFLSGASGILGQLGDFVKSMGPGLGELFRASLPFLKAFVTILEQAAKTMMPAFLQVMKQFTPLLPVIVKGFGTLVQGIAGFIKALGPGMKSGATVFVALMTVVKYTLIGLGYVIDGVAIFFAKLGHAALNLGHVIHEAWDKIRHWTADTFDHIRHDVAAAWDWLWKHTIGALEHTQADLTRLYARIGHDIASAFDTIRHDVASIWDHMWHDVVNAIGNFAGDVFRGFDRIVTGIWNALRHLPGLLWNLAKNMVLNIAHGAESVAGKVLGFFKGIGKGIMGALNSVFHFGSPSRTMRQYGRWIIEGLSHGIQDRMGHLAGSIGHMGRNVTQWISQALQITGKPMTWLPALTRLVSLESGGNPLIVNSTPVGGEHATGLFQTLPSTFAAYSLGGSIFNPVADAIAGIRYLSARYGSPYNIPGLFSGNYQGYWRGGMITEPIAGVGLRSGINYAFGERGPELVTPVGHGHGYGGGNTYYISVAPTPLARPADVGREVVGAIREFEKRSGKGWRS